MAKKKAKKINPDEVIEAANSVSSLWMEFGKFMRKSFRSTPVSSQDEQRFLELKSDLARLQRVLAQKLPEGLKYGSNRITQLMTQAISIDAMRELPTPDKKGLYNVWHESYIAQQHLLGILDVIGEGYPVRFETLRAKSGNIKADLAQAGKKTKAKRNMKPLIVAVLLACAAGAVWYAMN